MSIRALSRTVKHIVLWLSCVVLFASCTIRSGEELVLLQPDAQPLSAMAVRFVGSEGVMWRTIEGLTPDTSYQVVVQAQLQAGAMQLVFRDTLGDTTPLVVIPGRVEFARYTLQSNAQGVVMLEEMTYQSRGGEYQLRFVPLTQPNTP
ncbi:MAG: hypothetical protein ACO3F2_13320 [Roseiflexaceae bacterium]